jgi:CBS domain-containing protein
MSKWLTTKTMISLREDAKVADALGLMEKKEVHHLLIVNKEDKVVALFSPRSFLAALAKNPVKDVMAAPVLGFASSRFLSIGPDASLGECLEQLKDSSETCVLVLDQGKGVGIVTESDLNEILAKMVAKAGGYSIAQQGAAVMADSPFLQSVVSLLASAGI